MPMRALLLLCLSLNVHDLRLAKGIQWTADVEDRGNPTLAMLDFFVLIQPGHHLDIDAVG